MSIGLLRALRIVLLAAPLLSGGVAAAQGGGAPGGSAGSEGGGTNPDAEPGTTDTRKNEKGDDRAGARSRDERAPDAAPGTERSPGDRSSGSGERR